MTDKAVIGKYSVEFLDDEDYYFSDGYEEKYFLRLDRNIHYFDSLLKITDYKDIIDEQGLTLLLEKESKSYPDKDVRINYLPLSQKEINILSHKLGLHFCKCNNGFTDSCCNE
jgi:hypothetical protein